MFEQPDDSRVNILLKQYDFKYQTLRKGAFKKYDKSWQDNLVDAYKAIDSNQCADTFFANYGVGSTDFMNPNKPYERFDAYTTLLALLREFDTNKFYTIHKGTPYYFISLCAFNCEKIKESMVYMDAAVSEDLKRFKFKDRLASGSEFPPSIQFYRLTTSINIITPNFFESLRDEVNKALFDYSKDFGSQIELSNFRGNFIDRILPESPNKRSILTALYTFILEYATVMRLLELRSDEKGSMQVFIDHLFEGARLFESLVGMSNSKPTLDKKIMVNRVALKVEGIKLSGGKKLSDAIESLVSNDSLQVKSFKCAYIIRNTTGHSLIWDDTFYQISDYSKLYKAVLYSILWTIDRLWLNKS